jgi:PBSX family phage terminase large subunit
VYITEANECAKPFLQEVFDRTISSSQRWLGFDLNPKVELHWFYTEILVPHLQKAARIPNYGLNYEHFTLYDNLSIDSDKLKAIIETYNKNSLWYKRDILGLRASPEGAIYDMWSDTENTFTDDDMPLGVLGTCRRYIGIDYGTTNPMVFLDVYDDGEILWVYNEYYYDSRIEKKQKTDSQYADDLETFIGPEGPERIILDPSAASFKAELRQRGLLVTDADNEVLDGIRMTATMIGKRWIRVHKTRCPNFQKEITSYIWDEKATEKGKEQPVKQNDHAMDDVRYIVKTMVKPYRLAG